MRIDELAERSGVRLLLAGSRAEAQVARVCAADTMSELIAGAASDTVIVTHLDNVQLARVAELTDAPGVCLVDGAAPGADLLAAARRAGTAVLVSPLGLEDSAERLRECLG